MSTQQYICFTVACDRCGGDYTDRDDALVHFTSEADALSAAESDDWAVLPDGRLICEPCAQKMLSAGEIVQDDDAAWGEFRLAQSVGGAA